MPDSYGKRNRAKVRERKAEVREERRIARLQRKKGLAPATGNGAFAPTDDAGGVPAESVESVESVEEVRAGLTTPADPVADETAAS
jgi:hypothetical protein